MIKDVLPSGALRYTLDKGDILNLLTARIELQTKEHAGGGYYADVRFVGDRAVVAVVPNRLNLSLTAVYNARDEVYADGTTPTARAEELRELDARLTRLRAFIDTNPKFKELSLKAQARLHNQALYMHQYLEVLGERIAYDLPEDAVA
jgi:hypothetical protein